MKRIIIKKHRRGKSIIRRHKRKINRRFHRRGCNCSLCKGRHTFKDEESWNAWRNNISIANTERYRKKREASKDIMKKAGIRILFEE